MDIDFDRLTSGLTTAEGKTSEFEHMVAGTSNLESQRQQRQKTQQRSARNCG